MTENARWSTQLRQDKGRFTFQQGSWPGADAHRTAHLSRSLDNDLAPQSAPWHYPSAKAPAPDPTLRLRPRESSGSQPSRWSAADLCLPLESTADAHGAHAYRVAARLGNARSGGIGLGLAWQEEPCARWPAGVSQDRYTGPWNHPTASPILVVGDTGDPITPYRSAVAMSRDLARARLLTVHGFGHTANLNPDTCFVNYEIRYLTTGALPPDDAVCQQNTRPFPTP